MINLLVNLLIYRVFYLILLIEIEKCYIISVVNINLINEMRLCGKINRVNFYKSSFYLKIIYKIKLRDNICFVLYKYR